jgi:5-formyltetrahydrofolate cyclo-ligase
MNPSKADLRVLFKEKRNQLTQDELKKESEKIALAVEDFCEQHPELEHFHLFFPIQKLKEVNTFLIRGLLERRNKTLYTSVMGDSTNEMGTILVEKRTEFVEDRYGIPVPRDFELISPEQIQVVFVPLLAVDYQGQRIGYGKGYYDRFLATIDPKVIKIGLSILEPIPHIPSESFDIPLDYCFTPKNMFNFSK